MFPLNSDDMPKYNEYLETIKEGDAAYYRVTSYVDTLFTAMNPKDFSDPHPCCIDIQLLDENLYDSHYIELVNCTQRHVCRSEGYCKSKKKSTFNQCRFGYPFELNESTKIMFSENINKLVDAVIVLARNDPYMNPHIRVIAQE